MKKILFVTYTLGFGGAERSLVNLLHEMPREQYQVDVLLFQKKGGLLPQLPQWVRVPDTPSQLNCLYGPVSKAGSLAVTKLFGTLCARLARKSRKSRSAYRWKHFYCGKLPMLSDAYDVAVAYGGSEPLYLVHDRVRAKKKLVWIHNDYLAAGYSAEDDRQYLENMDGIVSVSHACVQVLQQVFPTCAHKTCCIENITSSSLIRSRAAAFMPPEFGQTANLLSVGRLMYQKGFDLAIEAAALLKKRQVAFCWYVIGEGALRQKLEKQIRESGVEDCFVLLGTRENPYPYLANCTLLVQPSRFEGKSVVLDEAKILATPIAATQYPTVRDQIKEDCEGVILPMTPEGIADGIGQLLCTGTDRLRAYMAAREYGNRGEVTKYLQLLED